MSDNPQICSSKAGPEGLILSSFEVLQDTMSQSNMRQMKLKNSYSSVLDDRLSARSSKYNQECLSDDAHHSHISPHPCVSETNDGDEMFDVADQFRADDAGDSLDNDTNNNSLDRDDEGDDEEEEDEEEDEVEDDVNDVVRQGENQGLVPTSQDLGANNTSQIVNSPSALSDLRVHHHQQETYANHAANLPAHNFINAPRALWHSGPNTPNSTNRYSANWHLPTRGERRQDVFSGSSSPDESRDGGCEEQHWKFVHGQAGDQHTHWVPDHGPTKVVVGPASSNWVATKREIGQEQAHDLQSMHAHSSLEHPAHWGQHLRTAQADLHAWPKGAVFTPEPELNNVRNLFTVQPSQSVMTTPTVSNSYTEIGQAGNGSWNLNTHIPAAQTLGNLPRPMLGHDLSCRRAGTSGLYHQTPSQSFSGYQGQAGTDWTTAAMSPGPSGISTELPTEHYKVGAVERGSVCKSSLISKRGKGRGVRGEIAETHASGSLRPALDQVRQQTHPYQIKEQKKVLRDVYPATSANVHTLKASHIVSWYIDYLIHENEHLTQISRAFSLPVNLFHSDDFYFMDSLKKKVHFPSLKFLSWMQQNLPSINVNAIDFHEGRSPVISTWNQDWFWQNKSRRDIIHDVFFYFQHRRVTCEN